MASWNSHIIKALQSLESDTLTLPPFDEESIHETRNTIEAIKNSKDNEDGDLASAVLNQYSDRLQNGVDIYLKTRISRIMKLHSENNKDYRKGLSPIENDFLSEYKSAIASLKKDLGFDPSVKCKPPKGLNAEVIVLKDVGTIPIGTSYIMLTKNEVLTVRTSVAEELEHLGLVKINEYLK